ncbi:MAG: S1C family serine protease [Planctomycetota bacterium]|jgi:serine protease Do
MSAAIAFLVLLTAPDDPDELEALQTAVRVAMERVEPSVVRIETVGGIRQVKVPDRFKKKMTVPERPDEGDPDARKRHGDEEGEDPQPGGRTPRFKNEWEKMLAAPGFKKAEGPTTGLIVSSDGYIVSSAWNFEGKPNVVAVTTAKGKTYAARLLGIDRAASLALLKIEAEDLPVPEFLDPGQVRVGSWAFALGRAMTRSHVEIKYGIISAKNRIEGTALQTDAATSPGNYGGPLVDIEGRIYGIIVPLGARGEAANPNWYDSGIGFVAPIPKPGALIRKLGKEGVVLLPAFMGVQMDQDRTEPGALVTEALPGQPAAKAGLKKGDIVLEIDGVEVDNAFTLRFEIGRRRAGDKVKLAVQSGEERREVELELAPRPKPTRQTEKLPIPMPGPGGRQPKKKQPQ